MVKINRIYTKSGDAGDTHLVGGVKVGKDSLRVQAYGEVDELNSLLGMLRTKSDQNKNAQLSSQLATLQNELFDAGAELATPPGAEWPNMKRLDQVCIDRLEQWIDQVTDQLPELKSFVLPGGSEVNAWLHLARTVCRRAERTIVQLSRTEPVSPSLIIYFNRLSDLFFALARWESFLTGSPEYLWIPGGK